MRNAALALCLLLLAGCPAPQEPAPPAPQVKADPEGKAPAPKEAPVSGLEHVSDAKLAGWLGALEAVPAEAWKATAEAQDELEVYAVQSSAAASMFLQPPADPHRGAKAGAEWTAHAAGPEGMDLLRCRYQALGYPMQLREGWNLLEVQVTVPEAFSREDLEALLAQAVRLERLDGTTWDLALPADLAPSRPIHLTNAGAPAVKDLTSRDERVDLVLAPGVVRLVFYKRVHQLAVFNQDDAWFRDSTRRALQ